MIGIINYGAGNLTSLRFALERSGADAEVCSDPAALADYTHLILPGVGSFRDAMSELKRRNWPEPLKFWISQGLPFLGICLGMQLLFDLGDEHGPSEGLGFLPGRVRLLQPSGDLKVPHVGWNRLYQQAEHPIFVGIKENVDFYFVHSYHCVPEKPEQIITLSDYGGKFASAVMSKNIVGVQFHPEKSQPAGLRLLSNFIDWNGEC